MRIKYSELFCLTEEEFTSRLISDNNSIIATIQNNEIDSWKKTRLLLLSLEKPKSDFYINFEYPMPFCGERIDVLIESNENLFVIEIKQWSNSNKIEECDDEFVLFEGEKRRNPFSQVNEYCRSLYFESEEIFKGKYKLNPIVWMPNYSFKNGNLISITKKKYILNSKYYGMDDAFSLNFLISDINKPVLPIKYSNLLSIKDIVMNNVTPALNDEYIIFNQIIDSIANSRDVIVCGTAGSGKTVLALSLLKHIHFHQLKSGIINNLIYGASNELVKYLSMNLTKNVPNNVFKNFWSAVRNTISDTICIFDESQRMTEEQVRLLFNNKTCLNSRLIWFIDEFQSIEVDEDNSIELLTDFYKKNMLDYNIYSLNNQFRCNGDLLFINDLKKVIELSSIDMRNYPIVITNDISKAVKEYNSFDVKSRGIVHTDAWAAGHIYINDFKKESLKEFGKWQDDMSDTPASVFKAQGAQKDNVLFLWGKDFVVRSNCWRIQKEYVRNKKWDSYFPLKEDILLKKMKAIIYVLMSRHNKNLIVYFDDFETYEYFKNIFKELN